MPSAEIITIGTELLLGQLVDTNTATVAQALASVGVDVYRETSVGDNPDRIATAVREALTRADVVICAGGLGPTVDDMTREAVAAATDRSLVLHEPSLRFIESRFAEYGWKMAENNRRQAMVPSDAVVMDNPHGSAPGFIVDGGRHVVMTLPGPPHELAPMLRERALPWLATRFNLNSIIVTRVLHTLGIGESDLDARIADLFRASTNPSIAVLARPGLVDVKITAKASDRPQAAALISRLETELRGRLGDSIFATDDGTLEESVGQALRKRGWSIALAESCTGGLVASMLAAVPGASDYFRGAVVAYSDDAKRGLLDVADELLVQHGAVSEEVASAMALGAKRRFGASLAISTTGIAGPTGGTPTKPIGLVYIGFADERGETRVRAMKLPGDRGVVVRRAAIAALAIAWKAAR